MKEIGGYIELDTYRLPMLHDGAVALNCGRNCLAYLIESRNIKKMLLPYFICDSVINLCRKYHVEMHFYHLDERFRPLITTIDDDAWFYVLNYYGQLTADELHAWKVRCERMIVDNAQAYFDAPLADTDTIYTCRKFFGVPDGAFLYTDSNPAEEYPQDESYGRMLFLLGRFERTASEFYCDNAANNHVFASEPIKRMSKLTENLLHGIDYTFVRNRRTENFEYYHKALKRVNHLDLRIVAGAFAYPFLISHGAEIRKKLQQKKIYIPTLWPNVLNEMSEDSTEYRFAKDILPLPCDQRYGQNEVSLVISQIEELLKEK